MVKDSHALPTGLGQGGYLGGAAGKHGGNDVLFHSFFSLFRFRVYAPIVFILHHVLSPKSLSLKYISAAAALGQGGYPHGAAGKSTGEAVE